MWLYYNVENVTSSVVRLVPHNCPTETSSVYGSIVTTALTGIKAQETMYPHRHFAASWRFKHPVCEATELNNTSLVNGNLCH